jgi:uncharacterized membrane protein YuzA (DUF378 family)
MDTMKTLSSVSLLLASIGALNWGLFAFADFDLVSVLGGSASIIGQAVYGLVALAGLYTLYMFVQSLSK